MIELARKPLTVLNPVGETRFAHQEDRLSERAATLDGKVLGFVDDGISADYFARFQELIRERFEPREMPYWKKPLLSAPSPIELIEEVAARCDAVIVGTCV